MFQLSKAVFCLAILSAQQVMAQSQPVPDALTFVSGDWQIRDAKNKSVVQDCDRMQRFSVSEDRKSIELTVPATNYAARYRVMHVESNRFLAMIEGEERLTKQGDPILWWFNFQDRDHFHFRRYDWSSKDKTGAEWVRC